MTTPLRRQTLDQPESWNGAVSLLPVDYVLALYNLVLIAVWAPLAATSDVARWMISVHLAALALPWLLLQAVPIRSPVVAALREIYPMAWLAIFWRELGLHCEFVGSAHNDALVAWVDRRLFGVNLSATWAPAMPMGWLSEAMQCVYFSYYALFVGLVLYLLLRRNRLIVRDLTLRLSTVYGAAYVIYAVAPTVGPMAMREFPRFGGEGAHGLFRMLNGALQAAGDAAGTAFPSTHVAGAVTFAWLAWRYCPRRFAWFVVALAVLIAPATVYTQNHFVLDALGGGLLSLWLQWSAIPTLERMHRSRLFQSWRPVRGAPTTEPEAA
jgi:membrane-associated phospholipid phosphatase